MKFEYLMEINNHPDYIIYSSGEIFCKSKNKYVKPYLDEYDGYYTVYLNSVKYRLHRLIATHYIPNPENLPFIDHIDKLRTNNSIENLRWVDRIGNARNRTDQSMYGYSISLTESGTYRVRIERNGKTVFSKVYKTLEKATLARDTFNETGKIIIEDKPPPFNQDAYNKVYRTLKTNCPNCGKEVLKSNIARHMKLHN